MLIIETLPDDTGVSDWDNALTNIFEDADNTCSMLDHHHLEEVPDHEKLELVQLDGAN